MSDVLTALGVLIVTGGAMLLVAHRLDLPTVPFFILGGIVASPFVEGGLVLELARYGIILLVFTFSTQIRFETVRTVLSDSEAVALGQIVVLGALGTGASVVAGLSPAQAVFIGVATALSSTIVGTGLLEPEIYRNVVHGRLAESIQYVQDLAAILFLLVLGAGSFAADPIALQLGYGVVLLAAALLVDRHVMGRLGRLSEGSDELMLVGVFALLIGFLGAAELAGVSLVVAAFVAGIAFRRDPTEHLEVLNGIHSIRDFFTAVFFVTLGALVAVPDRQAVLLAGVVILLTAVAKPAIVAGMLMRKGYGARSATMTGLSLDQVSEFALIIAIEGLLAGLLSQSVFDAIILAAVVTMVTSSLSSRYDERLYRLGARHQIFGGPSEKVDARSDVTDDVADHVVIVGFGRQGRRLAATCERDDHPYVVVENDPTLLGGLRADCEAFVFGDAMERYTWRKAGLEHARLVVSTVDSDAVSDRVLELASDAGVDAVLRARTRATALDLLERGAVYVNVPEVLAATQLVEHVEQVASGEVSGEQLRATYRAELDRQTGSKYYTTADELRAIG